MRKHWSGLTVFVDHPDVPMDNNTAERLVALLSFAASAWKLAAAQELPLNPLSIAPLATVHP